jgi:hypothetical protein
MFFMRQKQRFNQAERDEMIAFISRPGGLKQEDLVRLIRAVERPGTGVIPCPNFSVSSKPAESGNGPYVL